MPASASIAEAAKATPRKPASWKLAIRPTMITSVGSAVDSRLIARPWMMLVPWPVWLARAIDCTGR